MRIVVTGASGNLGTALLRLLREEDSWEVLGVCRRPPQPVAPYDRVSWSAVDLAVPSATAELTRLFRGADAVVHLAWAIQPVRDAAAMRAVNLTGTEAVLRAAGRTGVKQLVHASSLAAYAPGTGPVDESWPVTGIPSSAYSRQKVAAEWQLDAFAAEHPEVVVSRVRPTVVVQPSAATEIAKLFAGRPALLRLGRRAASVVGLAPLPRGLRMQLVHADDVAVALKEILTGRAGGAFNLAAEPLDVAGFAAVVGARPLAVPPRPARRTVAALFAARAIPVSPGWFDLAMQAPLIDAGRAARELDWSPRHGSAAAAAQLLSALDDRQQGLSPALQAPPPGHPDQEAPTVDRLVRR